MASVTIFKGGKDGVPKKFTTTMSEPLTGDQVFVRVTASGVCGTDLHFRGNENMVLGHEGVGVVEELGPACRDLKKGDRVGWGYQHDCCERCEQCMKGTETYCPHRKMYGYHNQHQGSFSTGAVWREAFLFKLPDELSDEDAAPLMCGGATVFQALLGYNTMSTETVGIMGVGGLGHLAIQFAARMGCRVVVLSGSESKRDEAMKLGAHEFVATKGRDSLAGLVSAPINRLLVTTAFLPDWKLLLPVLAPGAWVFPLTVADGNFEFPYMAMMGQGITVQGSAVSPRLPMRRMLDFAVLHNIKPVTETYPMTEEGVREALDRLNRGEVHFRAVLKVE